MLMLKIKIQIQKKMLGHILSMYNGIIRSREQQFRVHANVLVQARINTFLISETKQEQYGR